ncbi:DUF2384 domain-containing protein [Hwanghaeella grinnelliae]|uniref:DUF2384 domain-containing protein n=1 Tax=Hwanghaeella grinnelliae TaxID=2500179 RepID=A0A437QHK8_9PROT|nr:antitoxin Xre/MbcA/ParS toxin-binding domain-containing protein [Hwanghaeella grinnelliae]RVU33936.1 DUF2384 domain-containing protein [Hwanghaeella grinnelliae]
MKNELPKVATEAQQELGERIRVARKATGLTAEEFARRFGVTSKTVRDWEKARRVPRANQIVMMAGMLNVTAPWLLEGREYEPDWHEYEYVDENDYLEIELERRPLLKELYEKAKEVFQNESKAKEWIVSPALALSGQKPIDLVATEHGAEMVEDVLTRLEYGVYT